MPVPAPSVDDAPAVLPQSAPVPEEVVPPQEEAAPVAEVAPEVAELVPEEARFAPMLEEIAKAQHKTSGRKGRAKRPPGPGAADKRTGGKASSKPPGDSSGNQ